jgi:hypothetical protein
MIDWTKYAMWRILSKLLPVVVHLICRQELRTWGLAALAYDHHLKVHQRLKLIRIFIHLPLQLPTSIPILILVPIHYINSTYPSSSLKLYRIRPTNQPTCHLLPPSCRRAP